MKKYIVREDFDLYDGIILFTVDTPMYKIYKYISKKAKKYQYTNIHKHQQVYSLESNRWLIQVNLSQ